MGCISINTHFLDEEKDEFPLSIDGVRKWVQNEIGIHISELIISLSEQGEYDQSQNEILAGLYEELDALLYNLAGG